MNKESGEGRKTVEEFDGAKGIYTGNFLDRKLVGTGTYERIDKNGTKLHTYTGEWANG